MAIKQVTDQEWRKLQEELQELRAQVRRGVRLSDKRSTGAKFYVPESLVQIDGDVTIEGSLTVGDGEDLTNPLILRPGGSGSKISYQTVAGRERALIYPAGAAGYDDLVLQAGAVSNLDGRVFAIAQSTDLGAYFAHLKLDSNASPAVVQLYVADASGNAQLDLKPAGLQLNGIGATANEFSTDGTLAGNSDTALPTEKAVKTYVDGQAHDMVLISTQTRATAGTLTFSSIPATYKHLRLIGHVRGTHAAATDNLAIRFNNSSAAVYDDCFLAGDSSGAVSAGGNIGATQARSVHINTAISPASDFTTVDITVANYASTSVNKAFSAGTGGANNSTLTLMVILWGQWGSTAAINRIDLFGNLTANLAIGSTVSLYGIKG